MNCYIISYDVKGPFDYGLLHGAIQSYEGWAHVTESTWAVVTSSSAKTIRDNLKKNMPQGSRLFVAKSGKAGAWSNVICKSEWLKEHL